MSTQFVRYTPDIEAAEPYFDQNVQVVIGKLEEYIAGSVTTEGTGRAVRDAHAKGYGVVKAEVEILAQVPAEYAQGIYAVPGKHGALIRFSNGQPHAGPDMLLGPVAGMALKIFDITGPALLEDEPDTGTFDYATINAPVFFCNTIEHYLFIKDLFIDAGQYFAQGRPGQHRFFRDWVTGKGNPGGGPVGLGGAFRVRQPGADPPREPAAIELLDDGRSPARRLRRQDPHRPGTRVRQQGGPACSRPGVGTGGIPPGPGRRTA